MTTGVLRTRVGRGAGAACLAIAVLAALLGGAPGTSAAAPDEQGGPAKPQAVATASAKDPVAGAPLPAQVASQVVVRSLPQEADGAGVAPAEVRDRPAGGDVHAASPAPGVSFPGITQANAGGGGPPDMSGAVGPDHVVTAVNFAVRIHQRGGAVVSTVSLREFFAGMFGGTGGNAVFDPKVAYDPYGNRWILVATADGSRADSRTLVAVSQTADPTGAWHRYQLRADQGGALWADYPSLGFNRNWIVVTVNMFGVTGSGSFQRPQIYALDRTELYGGTLGGVVWTDPATLCDWPSGGSPNPLRDCFTFAPAITYDADEPTMYLARNWGSAADWGLANDGRGWIMLSTITPTAGGGATLTSTAFWASVQQPWKTWSPKNNFAPQAGTTQDLNVIDARMLSLVYRNGSLWAAHNVFLPLSAPTRSAVQWWNLTPDGEVRQFGRIDDPSGVRSRAYPYLTVNRNEDVLVGYSTFSGSEFASAAYSFRAASDAAGTMQPERVFKAGEAPQSFLDSHGRNRWGDYSVAVVDPRNDLDMWTAQEYAAAPAGGSSNWGTWWASVPVGTAAPANDAFAAAQAVSGLAGQVTGATVGATKEAGEPDHAGNAGGASVWYRWQAPAPGTVTIDTVGSSFDTLLGVYRGGSVGALEQVAANDDIVEDTLQSSVTFEVGAGDAYAIAVDGWRGAGSAAAGDVRLNWELEPSGAANDAFADAQVLSGPTGTVTGSNAGAGKETGEPDHAGNAGGASAWYRWTAPADGTLMVETAGSDFDTLLGVYTGASVGALEVVGANDDVDYGAGTLTSRVGPVEVRSGTTYQIAVDGYRHTDGEPRVGTVALGWAFSGTPAAPANDAFASARALAGMSGIAEASNAAASSEQGEPAHAGNTGGASVWFDWTAPHDGSVTFETLGSNFDTLLGVYTGQGLGELTTVGSNDDIDREAGVYTSRVGPFTATRGVTYRIAVDGYRPEGGTAASGRVLLRWTMASPPNALLATSRELAGVSGSADGFTVGAGKEDGEPLHAGNRGGASIWFRWTSPVTGTVSFDTDGSDFDTLLAVYAGTTMSELDALGDNDDVDTEGGVYTSRVEDVPVEAGATYVVAVDGYRVGADVSPEHRSAPGQATAGVATGTVALNWTADGELPTPPEACPPAAVPAPSFGDVAGNTHEDAVACIVWHGITTGLTATTYGPAASVGRDQMASFIARTIEAAGVELPAAGTSFTDVDGNVHGDRIEQLAAAGIVAGVGGSRYAPRQAVRRDQMASFLVRAYEHILEAPLASSPSGFPDVTGNVHEANIDKAATAGLARGTTTGLYAPAAEVRRDQMASFLARMLDGLAQDGFVSPPG